MNRFTNYVQPAPANTFLHKVQKGLFKYLWTNKPDRINNIMYGGREYEGVSMPNLDIQKKSLKIAWVQTSLDKPQNNWAQITMFPPGGALILHANISSKDNKLSLHNKFWAEVIMAWTDLSYKCTVAVQWGLWSAFMVQYPYQNIKDLVYKME